MAGSHTSWLLGRFLSSAAVAIFVVVVAVMAITGVTSAVVGATTEVNGFPSGVAVGQVLIQATQWAGIFAAFLILCALGLVWWQVQGWSDALEDGGDDDQDSGGGDPSVTDTPEGPLFTSLEIGARRHGQVWRSSSLRWRPSEPWWE